METGTVTVSAIDDKTGVASTTYSLDDGATWQDYAAPFTLTGEGKHTVWYRSTDKVGNVEDIKTATLYIDLTAPEAKISVDVLSKDLLVTGRDKMGSTTVEKTATGYTVTDLAGHMTKLFVTKKWAGKVLSMAELTGIQYDDAQTVSIPQTKLMYTWSPLPVASPLLPYQNLVVGKSANLLASYRRNTDKTSILIITMGPPTKTKRVEYPGLKLVTITTDKGICRVRALGTPRAWNQGPSR